MYYYHLAGQGFPFPCPIFELAPFEANGAALSSLKESFVPHSFLKNGYSLSCQATGWVGDAHRYVETWVSPDGILLNVDGGCDFYIAYLGKQITWVEDGHALTDLDRDILLGPALVLALALRGTWSLHASAAVFQERTIAFVGESGQGKSTLAAYLDGTPWRRAADDILPVTLDDQNLLAWPYFPQLKLPPDRQPGLDFPESLALDCVCLLDSASVDAEPELQRLPPNQAIRVLLSHTAGTRLFPPDLLAKHLDFCGRAAEGLPVYQLTYPHRRDALPQVKELLESIC